jgi:hypothetical protein
MKILIHEAAYAEAVSGAAYYESQQSELGENFTNWFKKPSARLKSIRVASPGSRQRN